MTGLILQTCCDDILKVKRSFVFKTKLFYCLTISHFYTIGFVLHSAYSYLLMHLHCTPYLKKLDQRLQRFPMKAFRFFTIFTPGMSSISQSILVGNKDCNFLKSSVREFTSATAVSNALQNRINSSVLLRFYGLFNMFYCVEGFLLSFLLLWLQLVNTGLVTNRFFSISM